MTLYIFQPLSNKTGQTSHTQKITKITKNYLQLIKMHTFTPTVLYIEQTAI